MDVLSCYQFDLGLRSCQCQSSMTRYQSSESSSRIVVHDKDTDSDDVDKQLRMFEERRGVRGPFERAVSGAT